MYIQHVAQSQPRPSSGPASHAQPQAASQSSAYQDTQARSAQQGQESSRNSVVIKVGMVGDAQIGKTSLMVKYVEGSWDEDYIQTLGGCAALRGPRQSTSTAPA